MDGVVANRSFMHQCMGKHNIARNDFKTINPVIFIMDFSHVMQNKKKNYFNKSTGEKIVLEPIYIYTCGQF